MFTCVWLSGQAQVNIITTIAGRDSAGFSGEGTIATDAKLNLPSALCVDWQGNVLIADAFNHRIRKINTLGMILTVAGNGLSGFNGDGGGAIDAKLFVPNGIASDSFGNIYIADGLNQRIRKVVGSTGIISTIIGTGSAGYNGDNIVATGAEINTPVGLHLEGNSLLICDFLNNRVRKVDLTTTIITTIAGSGLAGNTGDGGQATDAKLNGPSDVFTDKSDNIYIADLWNNTIRKVDASSGIITTIAGTGSVGYSGDGDVAINAKLNQPAGIFIDTNDNIYIAEYLNGTIRKINANTNIIMTVAGIGITGFGGDGGPATNAKLFCSDIWVDKYGNLIIADYENNRIRKVNNAVAVNGISKEVESKLYPNPTKGIFIIQTPIGISIVNIYNIAGMLVYQQTCTTTETEINITSLPSGVYMVYAQCGDKQYVSKVVKE
jgi:hypothetical protein